MNDSAVFKKQNELFLKIGLNFIRDCGGFEAAVSRVSPYLRRRDIQDFLDGNPIPAGHIRLIREFSR